LGAEKQVSSLEMALENPTQIACDTDAWFLTRLLEIAQAPLWIRCAKSSGTSSGPKLMALSRCNFRIVRSTSGKLRRALQADVRYSWRANLLLTVLDKVGVRAEKLRP
jgi:hypothetical protein